MPIPFRIKQLVDTRWVPDHPDRPEVENIGAYSPEGHETVEVIRQALLALVEMRFPGEFTSEQSAEELRRIAFSKIDTRSDALIRAGFAHRDVIFSMSLEAQARYTGMLLLAEGMELPLEINSLDDTVKLSLGTPQEVQAFCIAAAMHLRTVVDTGTQEKDRVRAMEDTDELAAYEDLR